VTLSLLSYNVWTWRADFSPELEGRLSGFLGSSTADVVFLAEMRAGAGQLERMAHAAGFSWWREVPSYPHHGGRLTLGLMARDGRLIESAEAIPLLPTQDGWHMGIRAVLRPKGSSRPWRFYGIHLWNQDHIDQSLAKIFFIEAGRSNPRLSQLTRVERDLADWRGPAVIAGDFNTFPFSRAWWRLRRGFRDACPLYRAFCGTYLHKGLRPRLDYIWHTTDLVSRNYSVLDPALSDHAAIQTELAQSWDGSTFPNNKAQAS
jgi:endonuclease/exonuclease/phosphatase (EEP) superfamily protein YafD